MEVSELAKLLRTLQEEAATSQKPLSRVYRAIGKTAVGIRASFVPSDETDELLIEVPVAWEKGRDLPEWRGLRLELVRDLIPPSGTSHLCLALTDNEARDVFYHFAADLVTSLEGISDSGIRADLVVDCVERWNRFFEKCGSSGLSETAQRGLLAELLFLERMLDSGIEPKTAVGGWKGCQHGYHDFDLRGNVVEVKSTLGKEPRRVWIANERQLDGRGLRSLHLFVVTLQITESGRTLPGVVSALRQVFENFPGVSANFSRCLVNAGYMDSNLEKYCTEYVVKVEELFSVREGFPRIVDLPDGIGHLRYCVILGACHEFRTSLDEFFSRISEDSDAG